MIRRDYVILATAIVERAQLDLESKNEARKKAAGRYFNSNERDYPFSFRFIKKYMEEDASLILERRERTVPQRKINSQVVLAN